MSTGGFESLAHPLTAAIPPMLSEWRNSFESVEIPVNEEVTGRFTLAEFASHTGTHIDAPLHIFPGARGLSSFAVDDFCGPGVVLRIQAEAGHAITAEELAAASPAIRDRDIVFISFGHAKFFTTHAYHDHPYLSEDAARFLVERGVRVIGVDTPTPDLPSSRREGTFHFPVHQILLGNDVLIIENLGGATESMSGSRVDVVMAPILMGDTDGGPIVPLVRRVTEEVVSAEKSSSRPN